MNCQIERPIPFSDEMVRAILAGIKTRTRRIWKPKYDKYDVGDRLWVRECFAEIPVNGKIGILRRADNPPSSYYADGDFHAIKWTPAMFMRREYSRILLELTHLWKEHLQDITEEEAKREGVSAEPTYIEGFKHIINRINGAGTWDANPEVAVLGFKVLEVRK